MYVCKYVILFFFLRKMSVINVMVLCQIEYCKSMLQQEIVLLQEFTNSIGVFLLEATEFCHI